MGVDLRGNLAADETIKYWIKIGNNANSGAESNKFKRFYGLLEFKPTKNVIVTAYGDYALNSTVYDYAINSSRNNNSFVYALYCNYKCDKFTIGVESFFRIIKNGFQKSNSIPLENLNTYGISTWAYYFFKDKINLVSRYDFYDPNSKVEYDHNSLIILAIDKSMSKVHLAPNIEIKTYHKGGKDDIIPRATFWGILIG